MESAILKSANTSAKLTFCERDGDYFSAVYESPAIKISKRIWGYTDCDFLVNLFKFIAKEWKGWEGVQEWFSIEEEFGITATSDLSGHVMLELSFREGSGPEIWDAKVSIGLEAAQTEQIARQVEKFFEP